MSTGSISLDILLNKILTDAISGGNESIRAIQKRYPSLSEKEAHEILAMVSATAQSNDDSAELVVTAPPSFALKTKPTKVTVREMLMGARKSILITGYSLSDYFAELVDCVIQKSQEGVLVKFFVNDIESQKAFDRFRWTDKKQGYQLSSFVEKEDASLNFFMTMIIPLLIDDVGTIQGAVTFLIIVVMMCALLSKTHLYYANPVLAILGYRVYEITFKSNPDFNNEICLAVVKGRFLKNPSTVEYKVINDTVLYMKEMNK